MSTELVKSKTSNEVSTETNIKQKKMTRNEFEQLKIDARQKFRKALSCLGKSRKFIRGIVSQCRPVFTQLIPSACIGMTPARKFKMYWNPEFVKEQKSVEHVAGVINHEINHLVRGHVTISKEERESLEEEILTIALEIHANDGIPRSWLPPQTRDGQALTAEKFNFQKGLVWQEYYELLLKRFGSKKNRSEKQKQDLKDTGVDEVMNSGRTAHTVEVQILSKKLSKKLKKALQKSSNVKSAVAKVLNEAFDEIQKECDKENKEGNTYRPVEPKSKLSKEEIDTIIESSEHIPGLSPGLTELILEFKESVVNWRQALKFFVATARRRMTSYFRPNKRYPNLMGIVPGRDSQRSKCRLLIFIDVSGSCMDFFSTFMSEIKKLSYEATGIAITFDTRIVDEFKLEESRKLKEFYGGGGTSLQGIMTNEKIKELAQKHRIRKFDGIVCLTDLYIHYPENAPGLPVLWIVTPGCGSDPGWGKVVKMEKEDST